MSRTMAAWTQMLLLSALQTGCWLSRPDADACTSDEDCADGEACYLNAFGGGPINVCLPATLARCLEAGTERELCLAVLEGEDAAGDTQADSSLDLDAGTDANFDTNDVAPPRRA